MALVGRTILTLDRKPALLLLATLSLLRPVHALHTPFADFRPGDPRGSRYKRSPCNSHSFHRSLSSAGDAVALDMAKLDSPSAQRNKEPIWDILSSKVLPLIQQDSLQVLEVAAGCGVHSHYFSLQLVQQNKREFEWYPSDPDEESRTSIQAYLDDEATLKDKLQPPVEVTLAEDGPLGNSVKDKAFHLMTCINMIHISPWSATLGLMKLAGSQLANGGCLYLYGPYIVGGETAPSNLSFDQSLKSRNPDWGVRNLEDVLLAAEKNGLVHKETIEMPANNLSVILQKPWLVDIKRWVA